MAVTTTLDARPFDNISTHRVVFGTVALGVYATGGVSFVPGDTKNLGEIETVLFSPARNATPIIVLLSYDYTNLKILAFDMAGVQVTDATDLSAYSAKFVAFGK